MIRANFHMHSNASFDGFNSYKSIYKKSKSLELDVIAITDHDTIDGAVGFKKWLIKNKKNDLQLIIGEEVTCSDGTHIIGLFLKQHINSETPLNVINSIHSQGGIVYFPHPARQDGIFNSVEFKEAISKGHFLEVFNAKINHSYNIKALNEIKKYPNLLPAGGSDAHYNLDILKAYTIFDIPGNNLKKELLELSSFNIKVYGYRRLAGNTSYLEGYYKIKEKITFPRALISIGKLLYPIFKNYLERKKNPRLEKIF